MPGTHSLYKGTTTCKAISSNLGEVATLTNSEKRKVKENKRDVPHMKEEDEITGEENSENQSTRLKFKVIFIKMLTGLERRVDVFTMSTKRIFKRTNHS